MNDAKIREMAENIWEDLDHFKLTAHLDCEEDAKLKAMITKTITNGIAQDREAREKEIRREWYKKGYDDADRKDRVLDKAGYGCAKCGMWCATAGEMEGHECAGKEKP